MEKENSYGLIKAHMMVTFIKIIFMEKVNTSGQMEESIKENGLTTKWKELEHLLGVMEDVTLVNTRTIRSMVKELSNGQMVENISENGTKANNMVKEPI